MQIYNCKMQTKMPEQGCLYAAVCSVLRGPGQYSGNQYLSGRLGRLCRAGNRVEAQQVSAGRPEILPWSDLWRGHGGYKDTTVWHYSLAI
jgi:hypothetical protein